jgi:hypothetical protein
MNWNWQSRRGPDWESLNGRVAWQRCERDPAKTRHAFEPVPWSDRRIRVSHKPKMLVTVALANKMARVVWALLVKGGVYKTPATSA